MLRIKQAMIDGVRAAEAPKELYGWIQGAIELEHSTIPPYLTAAFSLKPGQNAEARDIIFTVANEEMLHMTIMCNLLNAIGGHPTLDKPGFIPLYPGPLPMNIHEGLVARLQKASRGLIYDVFMVIEEPEHVIKAPVKDPDVAMALRFAAAPAQPTEAYATIGLFYRALKEKLAELDALAKPPRGIFTGDPSFQVVDNTWFPENDYFPITDLAAALKAIDIVVEQGEGTLLSPDDEDHELAHYYRFAQIAYGRRLVRDDTVKEKYSYSGAPVGLDPTGIYNLYPDAKAVDYAVDSTPRRLVERFNYSYTSLLKRLHGVFNGEPERLREAFGLMAEMRLLAADVVATPILGTSYTAAPTFEYTPLEY